MNKTTKSLYVVAERYKNSNGNIDEISSNMEAIRKAFPNAKVSYSFAKNGDGTNYVIRAKENGKIVYSSYVPKIC
jgi:hypothetical protein